MAAWSVTCLTSCASATREFTVKQWNAHELRGGVVKSKQAMKFDDVSVIDFMSQESGR
jgi:hypothetical protein